VNRSGDESDPLETGLGAIHHSLEGCPDAAALTGFAAQSLPSDQADRIRAHVSGCGVCDSLLEGLRRFDDPLTDTPPGWAAAERRLRARVFPRPPWRRWFLHPAAAYGIALIAVIVAVIPSRRPVSQPVVAPSAFSSPVDLQSLRAIDVSTTRGAVPNVNLGSEDGLVYLSFVVDIHRGLRYEASLDRGAAKVVTSSDGKGNFALLVTRDGLSPGAHHLVVTEINPASAKVERSFDFPFQH
jgi:hypothetical protein